MLRCGSHTSLRITAGALLHHRLRCGSSSSAWGGGGDDNGPTRQSRSSVAGRTMKVKGTTATERHQMRANWEKAFFARVNYDTEARRRFAAAMAERSAEMADEAARASVGAASPDGDAEVQLPPWPADAPAPRRQFRRLRPTLQARYIVDRLVWAERRVLYAEDYGSLFIMQSLNHAEMTLSDCEELLHEMNWMSEEMAARIAQLRKMITRIKYDNDLI